MAKIKIDDNLFERAKVASESAGYSSVEEFIAHCVDQEILKLKTDAPDDQVTDQLRGLGYIE